MLKASLTASTERVGKSAFDRIAALVLPPRVHRHRYHGVLAPNSPLRDQVTGSLRGTCTWLIFAISSPRPKLTSKKNRSAVTAAFKLILETPLSH